MRPKFHLPVLGYAFRITGVMNDSIAKLEKRFSLEPGSRGFFDFESNLLRLKNTHVADCKPQAPTGQRWDFGEELEVLCLSNTLAGIPDTVAAHACSID